MEGVDVYIVGKLLNTLCPFLSLHLEYSLGAAVSPYSYLFLLIQKIS